MVFVWQPKGNDLQIKRADIRHKSGPLVTQKPNTGERRALLNPIRSQHTPNRQHEYIHGSVQIRLCQTRTKHTTSLPEGLAKPPAWLPISSETSPPGAHGESQREGAGPDTKKGTMANVKAGWLLQGEAQLLLSEGKSGGWHPEAAPFLSSEDTWNTMLKWPDNTHINKCWAWDY